MFWKQFLTPVKKIGQEETQKIMRENDEGTYTLLDVRQPKEYKAGHLPGAKLIPLPQLKDRLDEIDPNKPTIVYCAVGGRSRVAAQILAGKDFSKVYNLKGGFKAWEGKYATGKEDQGLELFSGKEAADEILIVAYSLEKGLYKFYQNFAPKVDSAAARDLFHRLAGIEINHQRRIFDEYCKVTGINTEIDEFDKNTVAPAMEGGIDTEEYMERYGADIQSTADILDMAMAIEAQALDLYSRAAENTSNPESRKVLEQIADEEQVHLKKLGDLFEEI